MIELVVAVGINPDKRYFFSVEERIQLLSQITSDLPNVRIDSFQHEYLVKYAARLEAHALLRGIRNGQDLIFERTMRNVNSDMNPEIASVFLMPPRDLADISSSFVKGLVGPSGWQELLTRFVPDVVIDAFKQRDAEA